MRSVARFGAVVSALSVVLVSAASAAAAPVSSVSNPPSRVPHQLSLRVAGTARSVSVYAGSGRRLAKPDVRLSRSVAVHRRRISVKVPSSLPAGMWFVLVCRVGGARRCVASPTPVIARRVRKHTHELEGLMTAVERYRVVVLRVAEQLVPERKGSRAWRSAGESDGPGRIRAVARRVGVPVATGELLVRPATCEPVGEASIVPIAGADGGWLCRSSHIGRRRVRSARRCIAAAVVAWPRVRFHGHGAGSG
jgi:hypothetical protein